MDNLVEKAREFVDAWKREYDDAPTSSSMRMADFGDLMVEKFATFAQQHLAEQWVRAADRVPPINEPVLVLWSLFDGSKSFVEEGYFNENEKWQAVRTDGYNEPVFFEDDGNVLAWTNLPKSYEPKEDETK